MLTSLLHTPVLKNNGDPKHTKTEQQKENSGRPQKGSLWSLFRGPDFTNCKNKVTTATLLGLQLQNCWECGGFPEHRGLSAYKIHLNCSWQSRTVVKFVWSQEQVHIWQITPIKTVMSTIIKYFGKTRNVHLWEPGKIWQIFIVPVLYQQVNYSNCTILSLRERQLAVRIQGAALLGMGETKWQ